jgi:16S rRNA (guanine527-N7)-methyltransferase
VATRDVAARISRRALRAGVTISPDALVKLDTYLDLLTLWNRRINLTALGLEPLSDEAIDRLIVEPAAAARQVRATDRLAVDIGSGGGSPAIPFLLIARKLRMILVEVKVRKCAFLREVIRQLEIPNAEVENRRFEELLPRSDLHEAADLVTLRAVRADQRLWTTVQAFLRPGGRVFWFGAAQGQPIQARAVLPFTLVSSDVLVPATNSQLAVLEKLASAGSTLSPR